MAKDGIWRRRIRAWREAGITEPQAYRIVATLDRDYQNGWGAGVFGSARMAGIARDTVTEVYAEQS